MKKFIAITSCILIMCLALTACGTDVCYTGEYDTSKYAQITDVPGISVLIPKEIDKIKETSANIRNYDQNKLTDHAFYATDGQNYQLYQPGKFFLYIFSLGKVSGIADKHDVAELSALMGTSSFLSFASRDPNTYTSTNKNGNSQVIYGAYITESTTGNAITYLGYVTILENGDTGEAYCLVDGYGDDSNDATALELAQNFLLVK